MTLRRGFFGHTFFITFCMLAFFSLQMVSSLESAYGPKIIGNGYTVSRSKIDRVLSEGDIFTDFIDINN